LERRSSAPKFGVVIVFYTDTVLHTATTSAGFDPSHIAKSASEVGVGCILLVVRVCLKNIKVIWGACEKTIWSLCRYNLQVLGGFSLNNFVVCVPEKGFAEASVFNTNKQAHGCKVVNADFVNSDLDE